MAIQEFRATTIKSAALKSDGAGIFAGGQFVVVARFDGADAARYEYRQYIKGTAILQQGSFSGSPASMDNWVAKPGSAPEDGKDLFLIPGGLPTSFREDGLIRNGRNERFGYRANAPVLRQGIEDRYLPDQVTGAEYRLRDTWGLRAPTRRVGLRLMIDIVYKGAIIDRQNLDQVVRTLHWGVHLDVIVT